MLDSDLEELYDVPTKVFNQAVKRNKSRFPSDFMFQLTSEEFDILRSQIVTLKTEILATHKDLANKLEMLESKYDAQFKVVFDAIRQLMTPPAPNKRKIDS